MTRKKFIFIIVITLFSIGTDASSFSLNNQAIIGQIQQLRPSCYFGFQYPLGSMEKGYDTGFSFGVNAFHREKIYGSLHPGINFSFNFLPPESTNDDSYADISIIPGVRYFQPSGMKFQNPLILNDPFRMFVQTGFGITQWNTKGSSKFKVFDSSVSDTDFAFNLGAGLTSGKLDILLMYTNIFAHNNSIKYCTLSVGFFF